MASHRRSRDIPDEAQSLTRGSSAWIVIRRLAVVAVVAALVAVGIVTLLRLWQPHGSTAVDVLVALTPWFYGLALCCLGASAVLRHRALVAVAAALVVIGAVVEVPLVRPWGHAAAAVGPVRLKVFDANVRNTNLKLGGIAAQIERDHPDLVTLEEITFQNLASLEATGVLGSFGWSYVRPNGSSVGFGVWSRVPLVRHETWYAAGHPEMSGELELPGGPAVSLLVVHTVAPIHGAQGQWAAQLSEIARRVSSLARPALVVGDFNATADMKEFRSIEAGMSDAAVATGEGWRMTWPANHALLPALVRIDHVLYSRGLTVTAYSLGAADGSDHRPVLATLGRAAS